MTLTGCYEVFNSNADEEIKTKYDIKFHQILVQATKNIIIINSYNTMNQLLGHFIYRARLDAYGDMGSRMVFDVHENLYHAIISRKPEEARIAMKAHMRLVKKHYQTTPKSPSL